MKNYKKIILFFAAFLVFGAIWFYQNWRQEEFMPAKENMITIKLGNINNPLFLKAKAWGITGNHEEIVLSQSDTLLSNKTDDYIFYTSEVFYKEDNNGKVFVYVTESLVSEPVGKIPNVIIIGLKTADEIRDYKANYQKYGLQRISVYK